MVQDDRDRLVREQLAGLPERYRLPLVYCAIQGLDYATVAEILGVPLGTLKTNVFRGKKMLRERVEAVMDGS